MSRWNQVVSHAEHRPWPMPSRPWTVTMRWHDLLFAHWPLPPHVIRPSIPSGLDLDTFDGSAWIGVVPFRMSSVGPRGLGWLPGMSAFAELNVRTYVRAGGRPGVWFYSLDASSAAAVEAARTFFHLPYFRARIRCELGADGFIHYDSRRCDHRGKTAGFAARYRPAGSIRPAADGSLDAWLTERYCLYAADARGRLFRGEIHHAPWPLQPAELAPDTNTMAAAAGIPLPLAPPLLHFAERLDVVAWTLEPLGEGGSGGSS